MKMETSQRNSSKDEEIIFEVLSWLPVKSLTRVKCVSRFFNSLVSNPNFVKVHQEHIIYDHSKTKFIAFSMGAGGRKKFYTIDPGGTSKASSFRVEKLDRVTYSKSASAKGLLCLWSPSVYAPAIILNPSTRETRHLPCIGVADKEDWITCNYLFGFDSDKKKHKILMTIYHNKDRNKPARSWVLTLGTGDESWREIKSIPYIKPVLQEGIHIDGVVYFFSDYYYNRTSKYCIVEFNFTTEEFRIISSMWDDDLSSADCFKYQLVEVDGKLAAIDFTSRRFHGGVQAIWILQQSNPDEWVHHELVSSSSSGQEVQEFCNVILVHPILRLNLIFLCDLKKQRWRAIKILGLEKEDVIIGIYSYDEDILCPLL